MRSIGPVPPFMQPLKGGIDNLAELVKKGLVVDSPDIGVRKLPDGRIQPYLKLAPKAAAATPAAGCAPIQITLEGVTSCGCISGVGGGNVGPYISHMLLDDWNGSYQVPCSLSLTLALGYPVWEAAGIPSSAGCKHALSFLELDCAGDGVNICIDFGITVTESSPGIYAATVYLEFGSALLGYGVVYALIISDATLDVPASNHHTDCAGATAGYGGTATLSLGA